MYPVLIDIKNKNVLVIGGGKIATRKIKNLLPYEPNITVISPIICEEMPLEKVTWRKRVYKDGDLEGFLLIFACTNDQEVNLAIKQAALPNQLVNNTGDKKNSEFYNMKLVDIEDRVSISVSTRGASPKTSKAVGNAVEEWARKKIPTIIKEIEI